MGQILIAYHGCDATVRIRWSLGEESLTLVQSL
jgi:hypothetical protein